MKKVFVMRGFAAKGLAAVRQFEESIWGSAGFVSDIVI